MDCCWTLVCQKLLAPLRLWWSHLDLRHKKWSSALHENYNYSPFGGLLIVGFCQVLARSLLEAPFAWDFQVEFVYFVCNTAFTCIRLGRQTNQFLWEFGKHMKGRWNWSSRKSGKSALWWWHQSWYELNSPECFAEDSNPRESDTSWARS